MASCSPSPKVMKREKHVLMLSLLASICSTDEELAALVLAGRIAHAGRAAAHERDRLAGAGLLQPVQHHDREQMADMQRRAGAVVADIGGQPALERGLVDALGIGGLVDEASLGEDASGIRIVGAFIASLVGWSVDAGSGLAASHGRVQRLPPSPGEVRGPSLGRLLGLAEALVEVLVDGHHQLVDLAVEEVVGALDDGVLDLHALLRLHLLDHAD